MSMRPLITPAFVATLAACSAVEPPAEGIPVDFEDNLLEQGIYDCTQRTDTGYSNGNAFTITVVTVDGKPVELTTANVYIKMQEAAAGAGIGLRIVSGFRTMAEQQYFYDCHINCNCNNCNLAAEPGTSPHQSGHALDLNTADAGVLDWLNANAGGFGFARTVSSEPWHWEYWGGGPEVGPCGASPECLQNPNYGGCAGSVITRCENNQIGTGDCGVYGAACSTLGGAPHCVHFLCWSNLNGGEDGRFCREGDIAGSCALGVYTETACAASGLVCRTGACVAPGSDVAGSDVDSDAATGVSADAGSEPGADAAAATDGGDMPAVEVDAGSQMQFDAGAASSADDVEPTAAERVAVGWHEGCCTTGEPPTPWLLPLVVAFGWRRRVW